MLTYGSLFTGAGGLEMGIQSVLPGRTLWHSDIDPGACKVLEHRWPDVPNLGDITRIDWSAVPRVNVLTGGFPCQDVSTAGAQAGLKEGTRSGLFHEMMRAIDALRPGLVVIENVRGLLTAQGEPDPPDIEVLAAAAARLDRAVATIHRRRARAVRRNQEQHVQHHTRDLVRIMGRLDRAVVAFRRARRRLVRAIGTVVGRLADLGYDAQWYGLRAADVGAPHGRFRVLLFAWPAAADADSAGLRRFGRLHPERCDLDRCGCADRPGAHAEPAARGLTLLPTPRSSDANGAGAHGEGGLDPRTAVTLLSSAVGADRWGTYAAAIARWERILGRPAPGPTKPGRTGNPRLNPQLVEWMMGWPPGHVTDVPGVTDVQALRICGNGVVPQQAAAATRALLHDLATEWAA